MSSPVVFKDPYVKHPRTPLDLPWGGRPKATGPVRDVAAEAREVLVAAGASDLLGMLFDPIKSAGATS